MSPRAVDDATEEDPTLAELLALIRTLHDMAGKLMAEAEQISARENPPAPQDRRRAGRRQLTEREKDVADLLVTGLSNRRIGRALGISERTVKNHLHSIYHKLDVGDRTQAVIALMREGRHRDRG